MIENAINQTGQIAKTQNVPAPGYFYKIVAGVASGISALALVTGCLTLAFTSVEKYIFPLFYALAFALTLLFVTARRYHKNHAQLLLLAIMSLVSVVALSYLPHYMLWLNIHGIISRTLVSGLVMTIIALAATCYSVFFWLGGKPNAFDISRYPILLLPTLVSLTGFVLMIYYIVINGMHDLNLALFTKPFLSQYKIIETWQNGWPTFTKQNVVQVGMLNHILGTLLLMGLTSLISLPIGISVGVFVTQYAGRKLAAIINFSTKALRSISGIILLLTALRLLSFGSRGSWLYQLLHGYGYDINGALVTGRSSFLLISALISLVVIPIIAQATQEGLEALPKEVYEGSLAAGATKEHTLFHLQLPWSLPNIVTGLLLGCAEAAGSLTVLFLIAGTGEYGVSPVNETTSLAYFIFDSRYGKSMGDLVQNVMGSYQYTAAFVLLILTLGLTAISLIMKRNLAKRYKGE